MFELLFLCGMFALLLGTIWEHVTALAAFPTIAAACAAIPLLAWADYLRLLRRLELGGIERRRAPLPPERFYWLLGQGRLRRMLGWSGPVAAVAWALALAYPARFALTGDSATGWVAGAVSIFATSRVCASALIYVRAAHWFDRMAPWAVGICRRTMYQLSDNPDFLGPATSRREEQEKSVY